MFPTAEFVGLAGWCHLLVMGVLIPAVVVRNYRRLVGKSLPLPNRMRHFKTTAVILMLLTVLSLLVAQVQWIELFALDSSRLPQGLAAGVAMYIGTVLFMRPRWRRAVERRARIVHLFMPDNPTERAWWIGVSTLAGIGEEITWRGVQTALLVALTGSYVLASVLSAISFGVAHYIQGWRSAAIITVFALGFQAVVWLSGSLFIAMAVHIAYDITAGLSYGRLGRELGYAHPEPTSLPASV
jgi:hypothetical protein